MIRNLAVATLLSVSVAAVWLAPAPVVAQDQAPAASPDQQAPSEPEYKPPLRGAPGGRVGGASRGTVKATVPLPTIQLLAPDRNAGLTTSASPTLYFFISGPVGWRTQFTISAPNVPSPIVEADIPMPREAGIYAVRTADYHVRLEPGVPYTWSVSVILNPKSRSRDIVASATLLRTAPDPALAGALQSAPANRRVALLAQAGIWYDAVAAAAEMEASDRHAALDALMNEVGLVEPARYDRQTAGGTLR
jgi:Domain of Unknown Function (DUF928)